MAAENYYPAGVRDLWRQFIVENYFMKKILSKKGEGVELDLDNRRKFFSRLPT